MSDTGDYYVDHENQVYASLRNEIPIGPCEPKIEFEGKVIQVPGFAFYNKEENNVQIVGATTAEDGTLLRVHGTVSYGENADDNDNAENTD